VHLQFKKNLGLIDRVIRVIIGLVLLVISMSGIITGWWASAAVVFALFQFLEAALAY